jgi:hypothetical protein
MRKKYDTFWLGLAAGLIFPLLIFAIIMWINYSTSSKIQQFGWEYFFAFLPKILSICVFANLLPFYFFLQTNRMYGVRGVLSATFALAAVVLVFFIF